jgi:hypothetical protein
MLKGETSDLSSKKTLFNNRDITMMSAQKIYGSSSTRIPEAETPEKLRKGKNRNKSQLANYQTMEEKTIGTRKQSH